MSKDDLRDVLWEFGDEFIRPFFEIFGGIAACVVVFGAAYLVLSPIIRRLK